VEPDEKKEGETENGTAGETDAEPVTETEPETETETDSDMSTQRRKFKRFPISAKVKYRTIYSDKPEIRKWLEKLTVDVSAGGIRLQSEIPPKEGDLLELVLVLPPDTTEKHFLAKIAWVNEAVSEDGNFNFGLTFLKISTEQQHEIAKHAIAGTWFSRADEESFLAAVAESLPGIFAADAEEDAGDAEDAKDAEK